MGVIIQSEWIPVNGAANIASIDYFTQEIEAQGAAVCRVSVSVVSEGAQILGEFSVKSVDYRGGLGADIPTTQTVNADGDWSISLDGIAPKYLNLYLIIASGVGKIRFNCTY